MVDNNNEKSNNENNENNDINDKDYGNNNINDKKNLERNVDNIEDYSYDNKNYSYDDDDYNNELNENISKINISSEVKNSFLDYSMSVIVSRAIPDVRDGLKPVHRRILYTMFEEGMLPNKKHQKSANAVGAIMGHYHPHGDSAIYEAMVRMAQDFTYSDPLIDGHGNFGSIDGDGAGAYRYTEARLAKIAMEMLKDINKNTVDFTDNYDGQRREPTVLPSRLPNILVNGSMGIAVGMATNIPPHNLGEVIDGCVAYINKPDINVLELMEYIKGPDFPTAAKILGVGGIRSAYETGKGTITIQSKVDIEEKKDRVKLIISEIPYQLNKTALITKIAELVRDKEIQGISNLHDESTLEGIRVVIDVKKGYNENVLLNNLYKKTQLQSNYSINLLMLVNNRPQRLNLLEIINYYISYQKTVVIRRTKFDLEKSEKRAHILEGLNIALDNIDAIIKIIKEGKNVQEIKKTFNERFNLTDKQSTAILDMQLRRLSLLERQKISDELKNVLNLIEELKGILDSDEKVLNIIKEELLEVKKTFASERKTVIDMNAFESIENESLIPPEDIIITLTNKGYIKSMSGDTYKTQNRGGVGVKGMGVNEEDFVENMIQMNTHDFLMFFTNNGKVYRLKGYEIPTSSRQSKGLPVVNLLELDEEEIVTAILKVNKDEKSSYCLFVTEKGLIKKTKLEEFEKIRRTGKIAIKLKENDSLISVKKTDGNSQIFIASSNGKAVHFDEKEVHATGRTSSGSRGIKMDEGIVVGCEITQNGKQILVVSENGYGKKTPVEKYRLIHRGGKGAKSMKKTPKTGNVVSIKSVDGDEDLIIVSDNGIVVRFPLEQTASSARVTQGSRLINLKDGHKVSTVTVVKKNQEVVDNDSNEDIESHN
ncbi:DNA gyrase subunit A [Methanobrevibacter curvatus]|uniref:DNA gyrase subunit A n=1 Tax=Methanobrevibacter curvatus TaxID=49547 RepID=A0A162FC48_9EURY|nr:DNA gyrase subunit A [Methanobrevibacter curvatus]KZX10835.1 DNA gyrase subunit A [Methanobrevibacter curvatus]